MIDDEVFADVGIKIKGNSSLRGANADTDPVTLPWRIRLDKYVDDQNLDGYTDFTVRSSDTETSLNEAVALDLLGAAGLATEQAVATRFSVNDSAAELRLTVQNLVDDDWVGQNFPDAGTGSVLYKAKAGGDWDHHGDDPDDYSTSFKIEAGAEDFGPLIDLLDLLSNGTDEEKATRLPELVDLDAFATYLSLEELIGNFDDIDGPGNNAYLFWDADTEQFTVVAWDHNLAFGAAPGGPGMPGGADMEFPDGFGPPEGFEMPDGLSSPGPEAPDGRPARGPGGRAPGAGPDADSGPPAGMRLPEGVPDMDAGMPGIGSNPLVEAFDALEGSAELRAAATSRLQVELIDSGRWEAIVDRWEAVLVDQAGDLVGADVVAAEARDIREFEP